MKQNMMTTLILLGLVVGLACSNGFTAAEVYAANGQNSAPEARCCMTPPQHYYYDSPEVIRKRMSLYKELGVDMLRLETAWGLLEMQEGVWDGSRYRPYFDEVLKTDFRIKMIVGTIMAPPEWLLAKHPDARLVSEDGAMSVNTLNFWYPGLREKLSRATTGMFQWLQDEGMLDRIDAMVVDFGPAGEPIYPAAWTQPGQEDEKFWCYSENAQADFKGKMKEKYGSLDTLNAKWGTAFGSWAEVIVPQPGAHPGAYWEDVLIWYRDAKRAFIDWQVDNFQKHVDRFTGGRIRLILYVPGSDIRPEQWQAAVASGSGDFFVRLMCDSKYLLETAGRKGTMLQYTGVDNRPEVEHLRQYMDTYGLGDVPMWGENAGYWECARQPLELADIILQNGLYGLDFTHAHFAFASPVSPKALWEEANIEKKTDPDEIMLNPDIASQLKEAYGMVRQTGGLREDKK